MSRLRIVNLRPLPRSTRGAAPPRPASLDLSVDEGECVCVCGPSGSGKTLLLRAIADLDPSEGEVYLDDVERHRLSGPQWRRRVAYLAAEPAWWAATPRAHMAAVPDAPLAALGLSQTLLDRPLEVLSTGERQRLALVRVLSREPSVLLLDEPTAALDARFVAAAEDVIGRYRQRCGAAIVWVTHDVVQTTRVGGRVLHLPSGRISAG